MCLKLRNDTQEKAKKPKERTAMNFRKNRKKLNIEKQYFMKKVLFVTKMSQYLAVFLADINITSTTG